MAVVKSLSGKSSTKVILNYVMNKEKTEEKIISGMNCNPDTAHEEMQLTKEFFDKTDGIKYHHVIQSFKPGEVNPELAHQIGKELAEKIAPGYEAVIATHTDKEHIHNHIVINSVHKDTGEKYHSTKEHLREVKRESNRLCEKNKLSTMDFNKKPKERLSSAELRIQLRGGQSWKQDLRDVVNWVKTKVGSLEQMKTMLKERFNVEMKIQNKNVSFKHPEKEKYCRGSKLGDDYTKEVLENGFTRGRGKDEEREGRTTAAEPGRQQGIEQGIERNESRVGEFEVSLGEHPDHSHKHGEAARGIPGISQNSTDGQLGQLEETLLELQVLSREAGKELSNDLGAIDPEHEKGLGISKTNPRPINRGSEKVQSNDKGKAFNGRNNSGQQPGRGNLPNDVSKADTKDIKKQQQKDKERGRGR